MSNDFREGAPSTSFEALIAAETLHSDEKDFASEEALELRLRSMVAQGIPSEVLDLVEALGTPSNVAASLLTQTYENGAKSSEFLAHFWEEQKNVELSLQALQSAEKDRGHAQLLRTGEVTIQQELQSRRKQREGMGFPENHYTNLLMEPIFRNK